jgi:hypothetical protein
MTQYQIEASDTTLAIEITEVGERQEQLLEAFGECQGGTCSCPTNEYEKVAAMEVTPTPDRIDIRLRTKPGLRFDLAEIAACLDYTVEKSGPTDPG